jgi:hypothetical protein
VADKNNPVIREILKQGRKLPKDVRDRYVAAALETGRIESNFQNVGYGDADSVNWRQERASIYGGDMSIRRSVARFFKEAAQHDKGQASYDLAADVQRPAEQYRGRYKTAHGEALGLLNGYGGQGAPSGPTAPTSTRTVTTPGVDNSAERRALVGQFLQQGGVTNPNAVLSLAGSYGQAADVPGTTTTSKVKAPRAPSSPAATSGKSGSEVLELIYNDGGKGYGIKNGQTVNGQAVYSDVWAGHANHVHVAAGPKTTVRLGQLAEQMGLHVGENPHFGGVDPVHVPGSYHYKGEAIDVSGDAAKMKAFARRVAAYNRTRKLPK